MGVAPIVYIESLDLTLMLIYDTSLSFSPM